MAIYKLTLPLTTGGKTLINDVDMMLVAAADAASAKLAAAAKYGQDVPWSQATATELVDTLTINSATALVGYRFTVAVAGEGSASVTGVATTLDTLDEIGAALATALNELDNIANAAYNATTQALTVASGGGGDDLGDLAVTVTIKAPVAYDGGGNEIQGDDNLADVFVDSITDEGLAADALTVTFNADATVLAKVLAVGKQV